MTIDSENLQMLIYQHVVQLSLLDYTPDEAFRIAHRIAAFAFDAEFTSTGLAAAKAEIVHSVEQHDDVHHTVAAQSTAVVGNSKKATKR